MPSRDISTIQNEISGKNLTGLMSCSLDRRHHAVCYLFRPQSVCVTVLSIRLERLWCIFSMHHCSLLYAWLGWSVLLAIKCGQTCTAAFCGPRLFRRRDTLPQNTVPKPCEGVKKGQRRPRRTVVYNHSLEKLNDAHKRDALLGNKCLSFINSVWNQCFKHTLEKL